MSMDGLGAGALDFSAAHSKSYPSDGCPKMVDFQEVSLENHQKGIAIEQ